MMGPDPTPRTPKTNRVRRVRTAAEMESKANAIRHRYNVGEKPSTRNKPQQGSSGVGKMLSAAAETGQTGAVLRPRLLISVFSVEKKL